MAKPILNYDQHLMSPSVDDEMKIYRCIYVIDVQNGNGMQDFFIEYTPSQDGAGIGSFLAGLFRGLRPIGKKLLSAAGKHALNTAVGVVSDIAHGDKWRDAVKYRAAQTGDRILDQVNTKVDQIMSGSGMRQPRMDYSSRITFPDGSYENRELKKIAASKILFSLHPPVEQAGSRKKLKKKPKKSSAATKRTSTSKKKKTTKGRVEKKAKKTKTGKAKTPKKKATPLAVEQSGSGYPGWL